jgi:hypothetical protein
MTSQQRAGNAQDALDAHQAATRSDDAVHHLLADLMHFCDQMGLDFNYELVRAERQYDAERKEAKPTVVTPAKPDTKPTIGSSTPSRGRIQQPRRGRPRGVVPQGRIRVLVDQNPKRAGMESAKAFALYRTGMTPAEYQALLEEAYERGDITRRLRLNQCLNWDSKKGFIRVE